MSEVAPLSPEIIQAVITQYFAATRSANKADEMVACFAEDTVSYDPVGTPAKQGHAQLHAFFQQIAALFVKVELCEEFITINGDEAAVKWTGRGIGHNGRAVTFEGIDLFEFNHEGKIQSLKAYWNPAVILAELQEGSDVS
ncbi:nuclear transport factor 2 family protein [Aliinostoc sp. HNIBRCY26]|uniref:nuclear transport factor 2 family protein n=1 Tax=Aliinostoc sp. HNIBRCY26 TaxID=3418997 RepID=UPI003CFD38AA